MPGKKKLKLFLERKTLQEYFEQLFSTCLLDCESDDSLCVSGCAREYDTNLTKCPCKSGCPDGCPCPKYECPDSGKSEVLILNTHKMFTHSNVPVITNSSGNKFYIIRLIILIYKGREDRDFELIINDDTEVYLSCSVTFKNELFIFGGAQRKQQISKLVKCELKNIGRLGFNHRQAACANVNDDAIYLCFNDSAGDYR